MRAPWLLSGGSFVCLDRGEDLWFSDAAAAVAKSLQSCPALCDPIDGSHPGSSIPGILQASILEWVAISFSNACMLVWDKVYRCKFIRVHTWVTERTTRIQSHINFRGGKCLTRKVYHGHYKISDINGI